MRPQERRLIGRLMLIATVLVALMIAVLVYTGVQNARRSPAPASTDNSSPSAGSSPGSTSQ